MSIGGNRRRVERPAIDPDDYIEASQNGTTFVILHVNGIWAKVFRLDEDATPLLIGRSSKSAINLAWDVCCSHKHANVSYLSGAWYIRDNDSRNGVRLNGATIIPNQDVALRHNDALRIGKTDFVIWGPQEEPPTIEVDKFPADDPMDESLSEDDSVSDADDE